MEATAGIVEDTLFPGVAQKRFYAPNLAYAGNYVVKVTPNNSYGPKRFLPVSQGDTVNAYVQAYTERPAPIQTSVSKPGKLLTWFAGMVGVNRGDANIKPIPTAGIALALGVSQSPAVFSSNATGPAEMKWKFYDSDSVLVVVWCSSSSFCCHGVNGIPSANLRVVHSCPKVLEGYAGPI